MMDIVDNPPKGLKNWIKRAKRCFTDCPIGVWFYVAYSRLYVMAHDKNGSHIMNEDGSVDSDYIIDSISIDDIDGGGW